MVNNFHP
jgi:hypothetical protein